MDEQKNEVNYIFYLQSKPNLDMNFFYLNEILLKINVNLIPISFDDLLMLDRHFKSHIVYVRNDLASGNYFFEMKNKLEILMKLNKINFYDVSSFSELENSSKLSQAGLYYYFQLPVNLKEVAMTIAVEFFKERNTHELWPGGRRAKLPSMDSES